MPIQSPVRCRSHFPHLAPAHSVLLSSGSLSVAVLCKTSHPRFAFGCAEAATGGTFSLDAFDVALLLLFRPRLEGEVTRFIACGNFWR